MKKFILLPLSAVVLCTGVLVAGCSDDKVEPSDETTTQNTVADETKESTEETSEESKKEYPKCEVESYRWLMSTPEKDVEMEGSECTNVTNLVFKFDYTEDSDHSYTSCTVERDGELLYECNCPMYFIYISDDVPIHVNEFGYLPSGEYKITIYNGEDVIAEDSMNVTFDEAIAEKLSIITINKTEEYGLAWFFTSDEHTKRAYEYSTGSDAIYCTFASKETNEDAVCKCELSMDGESLGTVEPTEVSLSEARFTIPGPFKAGTLEINYYVDDVLTVTSTLIIK